jgi:ribosomal protein S18 acetylase RimI-like enzyme
MVNLGEQYRDYIAEEWGRKVIAESYGFITYEMHGNYVYIADLYIRPKDRRYGYGKILEGKVIDEALKQKIRYVTCKVHRSDNDWKRNLKIYLEHCGYIISDVKEDYYKLMKPIGGKK